LFLFNFILRLEAFYKIKHILIEEPETNLHPTFQKLLPQLFQELSKELKIQFLNSTHSPFIISAAAEFGETQKRGTSWRLKNKIQLSTPIGNIGQILIDQNNSEIIYLMLVDPKAKRGNGFIF